MLECIYNIQSTNKKSVTKVLRMILEDLIDVIKEMMIVEIEIVIEEIEETEDQDQKIKIEEMIVKKIEDQDHNHVTRHYKESL